ncbi:spondin domain-containing protein [Flagellimonas zhangzhouensis]|uniref:Spondin_N n=1 Tax=Flagellimonas zhangzhouensis TaxID=1073328 RepID=A0A1H2WRR2_9FLAO|nr:spondin domain-containing protein [Allomuricauda zhangzhouensis]SDQ24063.1 Spondin_N [Allomuricauda zhangzhouensis]SDW83245.1 Spondin_N [Allomuricauda zhangzhouensis]
MKTLKLLFTLFIFGTLIVSCSDDDNSITPVQLNAGVLNGGPFTFTVDGTPDMVSGITLDASELVGSNSGFVITDDTGAILGMPPTIEALEGVDFDAAGTGICLIYHVVYEGGLQGLETGMNLNNLSGEYDLSNSIMVTRNANPSASFTVTIENVITPKTYFSSGPTEGIPPGASVTYSFNAGIGHYLNFATMLGQSNDLFFAPYENGIELYDENRVALTGDITNLVTLWDAGTEVNEEPGVGPNQAPRQPEPNTGMDENGTVESLENISDGFMYPEVAEMIRVELSHDGGTEFTLTINNISDMSGLTSPFAPGAWVIHGDGIAPFFMEGMPSSVGLERMAEDGNNEMTAMELNQNSGYVSPFAPGAFGINSPVFEEGVAATMAFEALAEDADPSGYDNIFNTPVGASGPGPIFPGDVFSFDFTAENGDILSFATMLGQSNDWVVGSEGISLFENGMPISGDITLELHIYDSGTEVDQYPGAGADQAPRQSGPDTGAAENGLVMEEIDLPENIPAIENLVRVTITVN